MTRSARTSCCTQSLSTSGDRIPGASVCCQIARGHRASAVSGYCRSRYAAEDLAEKHPERPRSSEDSPPTFRAACHIMRKLAALHRRHATRQRGRDRYIPLWGD